MAVRDPSGQDGSFDEPRNEAVVIRPSWQALGLDLKGRLRFVIGTVPLIIGTVVSSVALNHGQGAGLLIAFLVAVFGLFLAVGAGYALYSMLGAKLIATPAEVRVERLFTRTATVPIANIKKVVICTLSYSPTLGEPAVFALNASGRCVLSLYAGRWKRSDLDRLWRHVGIQPDGSWEDRVPYEEVGTRFGVQN